MPEFTKISDLALGLSHVYDIDRDGAVDVVGGRGVLLLANLDLVEVPGVPAANNGRPGRFDSDAEPDLAYATGTENRILVFPSVALGGGATVVTENVTAHLFDAHDVDGDERDDLATAALGGDVEIWLAEADGGFTLGSTVPSSSTPTPGFFADTTHGLRLAVADSFTGAALFTHDAGADFLESGEIVAPGLHAIEGFDRNDVGNEWLLGAWWFDNGFEVKSGVGVIFEEDDEWAAFTHSLEGEAAIDLGQGDLDGDGLRDVVVPRVAEESVTLELLCLRTDALELCGSATIEHVPESVAVMPDPPRLVYSTVDEGTWIGAIEVDACG